MNAGVLQYDGLVKAVLVQPANFVDFNGGTPVTAAGFLAVRIVDPEVYINGFGYHHLFGVCVNRVGPIVGYSNGLPICANGAIAVGNPPTIIIGDGGVPFNAAGRVAVVAVP